MVDKAALQKIANEGGGYVINPTTYLVEFHNYTNARDLINSGWEPLNLDEDACPLCFGGGVLCLGCGEVGRNPTGKTPCPREEHMHETEECWHCEGSGVDPSFTT